MGKESVILKLFASKGATSPVRGEMEARAPLSPISVRPRNKVAATGGNPQHQQQQGVLNNVHPTFAVQAGLKKNLQGTSPSSLCQKKQSAEYGENIATFPPGTPEHKFPAPSTPKCSSKRFGWSNIRQQSQHHEELVPGNLLFFSSRFPQAFTSHYFV